MLTKSILYGILMNCAQRTQGIGAAYLTDTEPDLDHDSFGATYADYEAGRFYSLDWQAAGANPNRIRGRFPVLLIEEAETTVGHMGDVQTTFHFIVVTRMTCERGRLRSGHEARTQAEGLLVRYLQNLREYVEVEQDGNKAWIFPGDLSTAKPLPGFMAANLPSSMTVAPWGFFTDFRGAMCTQVVHTCDTYQPALTAKQVFETRGVVRCPVC